MKITSSCTPSFGPNRNVAIGSQPTSLRDITIFSPATQLLLQSVLVHPLTMPNCLGSLQVPQRPGCNTRASTVSARSGETDTNSRVKEVSPRPATLMSRRSPTTLLWS